MRQHKKNKIRWRIPAFSPRNTKSKTPNESQQQEQQQQQEVENKRFSNEVRMQKR